MPHMNDVLELLKSAKSYLVDYDNHLVQNAFYAPESLGELIEKIEQTLHEWEILKVGHIART